MNADERKVVYVSPILHKRLKVMAAEQETNIGALIEKILIEHLAKGGKR